MTQGFIGPSDCLSLIAIFHSNIEVSISSEMRMFVSLMVNENIFTDIIL